MARPSQPLISKDATVKAALLIIDNEGLEALSLPRLARELNVKAPSLYHHFTDKSDILTAVAFYIVSQTKLPRPSPTGDWAEWFTQLALNFRQAVLRHRNAAPILLQHMPREVTTDLYERAASYLVECGVPADLHIQILEGLEKLSIGATISEAMHPRRRTRVGFEHVDPTSHPTLTAAVKANQLNPRQIFEHTVRCYLLGMAHFGQLNDEAIA